MPRTQGNRICKHPFPFPFQWCSPKLPLVPSDHGASMSMRVCREGAVVAVWTRVSYSDRKSIGTDAGVFRAEDLPVNRPLGAQPCLSTTRALGCTAGTCHAGSVISLWTESALLEVTDLWKCRAELNETSSAQLPGDQTSGCPGQPRPCVVAHELQQAPVHRYQGSLQRQGHPFLCSSRLANGDVQRTGT